MSSGHCVSLKFVGKMSVSQMSVGQLSAGQLSAGQTSVGQLSVSQMSVEFASRKKLTTVRDCFSIFRLFLFTKIYK